MNKAIFLDRDGVINIRKKRYVTNTEEFELIIGVEKWLKLLADKGFKLIVITNQSMVERGISTIENLNSIHQKMQHIFKQYGFEIDQIYYCTHRPENNCMCRKPKLGLFQKAINDFNLDVGASWLIGDEDSDIIAGKKIGCKTIKIETNSSIENAVKKILAYT